MAKLRSHCIFSMGSIAVLSTHLEVSPIVLMFGLLIAVATDNTIDALGHRRKKIATAPGTKKHIFVRSRLGHSILTAPLWGGAWGYVIAKIAAVSKNYLIAKTDFLLLVAAGLVASICHLFADALTESGVYLPFKRYRLMALPYDHWGLNLSLIVVGVIGLIFATFSMIKS